MRIDNPSILGTLQLEVNSRSDLSGSFSGSFLGNLDGTATTASSRIYEIDEVEE